MSSAFHERFKDRKNIMGKEGFLDIKNSVAVSKPLESQVFNVPSYKPQDTYASDFETKSAYSYAPSTYTPDFKLPMTNNTVDKFAPVSRQSKPEQLRKQTHSAKPIRNLVPVGRSILRSSEQRLAEDFRPYTIKDYQNIKSDKYYELGGLGPSHVGTEDWKSKKEALDKRNLYAKQVQLAFANIPTYPVIKKIKEPEKEISSRERAIQFAKMIQRPPPRVKVEESKDNLLGSVLEELEKKHLADKISVENIRSGIKY
jgi:hypothetical protein